MKIIFPVVFFLHSLSQYAQTDSVKLKFDLSVRYRFERWEGMNVKNYGDDSPGAIGRLDDKILYHRIITGFTWIPAPPVTVSLHMQDSRAFGWSLRDKKTPDVFKIREQGTDEPYYLMNPGEEFFEVYDAFVQYRSRDRKFMTKLGRQKIFFGDNHIFGPGEWGNTGRWTWDALRLTYQSGKNSMDLFAGGTKIHHPHRMSVPFTKTEYFGGGAYGHLEWNSIVKVEPFYAYAKEGSADYIKTLQINKHWLGVRLFNEDIKNFILDATLAYEFGRENEKKIRAYGFFTKLGYRFESLVWKPVLSIRETFASGGRRTDSVIRTFEPAFGASDKYYGWMNIAKWSNLDNREIVLELYPGKGSWIEIKYNWFFIPVPDDFLLLKNMKLNPGMKHLGNEFDLFARFKVGKSWQLVGLLGYFVPKDIQPITEEEARNAFVIAAQVLFTL